jgi:6-phosphogluconolactonase
MKFRKPGQILLATAVSAIVGLGLTSCGQSNTIDFLYVTANKNSPTTPGNGEINVYYVDQESGAIAQIQDSPYDSGGQNPVAEVASPNGKYLFVINEDNNTLVQFAIGTDAKLYPQMTCNTPGTQPNSLAVNAAGTELFVTDYYQSGFNQTNPGPGDLVVYPLTANAPSGPNNNFGENLASCTPVANPNGTAYWALGSNPGGVAVSANGSWVYATNTGSIVTTTTPPTAGIPVIQPVTGSGTLSAFSIGSGGVLSPIGTYPAGTAPTALAVDPTSRFLYVTDAAQDQVIEYLLSAAGVPTPINPGVLTTGTFPNGITVDPRGLYVYITNYTDGTISTYNINTGTGVLTANATPTLKAGPGATCVIVEPSLDRFLFTSNFLENEVSSSLLNPDTGSLTTDENSPYPSGPQPTCVAAVPHGNHSTQYTTDVSGGSY